MIGVAAFMTACVAISLAVALTRGNTEFLFYIAVMVVLSAAVLVVHLRLGLPAALLWALAAWGALHMAGGLVPVPATWPVNGPNHVLYSLWLVPRGDDGGWLKYDHVVHVYGFGVATWLCWRAVAGAIVDRAGMFPRPTPDLLLLAAIAGCGLGALNELVEFVATRLTATNVGGYVNTGWDLVANALGATSAVVLIGLRGRRHVEDRTAPPTDARTRG